MTLVVGDLDLELNVVADVGVLPHEELKANWELLRAEFFVQLTL